MVATMKRVSKYFDKRLNASVVVFRAEQDNVAEEISGVFVPGEQTVRIKQLRVVSKGVELDVNGGHNQWNVGFGVANFEAEDAKAIKCKQNHHVPWQICIQNTPSRNLHLVWA